MKYAKWKAVEINRCFKNGITPTPGPPTGEEGDELFGVTGGMGGVPGQEQPPPFGFSVQVREGSVSQWLKISLNSCYVQDMYW